MHSKSEIHPEADPAVSGWILYDGSCGICNRYAPSWERVLKRHGFKTAPLQDEWVREKLGMDEGELLQDMRLLLADGSHLAGAEVYRYAIRRVWWMWPLYLFSVLPGGRQIFDWAYRTFARNRHRISHACGLRPDDSPKSGRATGS